MDAVQQLKQPYSGEVLLWCVVKNYNEMKEPRAERHASNDAYRKELHAAVGQIYCRVRLLDKHCFPFTADAVVALHVQYGKLDAKRTATVDEWWQKFNKEIMAIHMGV